MENYFFNFEDFETEIQRKLNSQSVEIKFLFKQFSDRLINNINFNIDEVNSLFDELTKLPFNKIYKNYLSHHIRVADSLQFIKKERNHEDINFALCHNIIENGFMGKLEKNYLNKDQIRKINILTIDRKREREKKYLNEYYNKIENYSEELILFKSLDKLDNTLLGTVFHFDVDHIYVIKNEVYPRIKQYNSTIAYYLNDLVDYVTKNKKINNK